MTQKGEEGGGMAPLRRPRRCQEGRGSGEAWREEEEEEEERRKEHLQKKTFGGRRRKRRRRKISWAR